MTFQLPEDLSALSPEDLDKLSAEALAEYEPLASIADDDLTDEQLAQLEALAESIITIQGAQETIAAAAQQRTDRIAAVKAKVTPVEEPVEEPAAEAPVEEVPVEEPIVVPDDASELEKEKEPVTASGKPSIVARANGRVATPEVAAPEAPTFSLIAAADVPGISAGSVYENWDQVITAFGEKIEGFIAGTGKTDVLNRYPIAKLKKPVTETFISSRASQDEIQNAITAAIDNYSMPGDAQALVATGGWAAPSQINYDLPVVEQAPDGLLTLPEITVERGGFQHTRGVDLVTVTGDANRAFTQTETQAIASTVKPFLTMGDVTFVDERLDVIGHGMRAKFLTLQGYPELVKRYVQLSNTAYIKYKNADLITRLLAAAAFTPVTAGAIGSVAQDTIDAIALQARRLRYKLSLKQDATFQGIAPIWLKDVIREDLAKRSGWDATMVPDSYITSLLASRGLSLQFVRDYAQDLGIAATAYPTTAVIHLWLPGKFVAGGGPVVSFDALYDYASLTTNTYTQFFIEESRLVANMNNSEAVAITVSTVASERYGRTGTYDLGSTHAV